MQHKYNASSYKIKVFLSSAMFNDQHLYQRMAIRSFFERMPFFELFAIEESASPADIEARYLSMVSRVDIVLLILQEEFREAVFKEYTAAQNSHKRIFAYINDIDRDSQLKSFVNDEVRQHCTTKQFFTVVDLIDSIEKDLIEDLLGKYIQLYEENRYLNDQLSLKKGSASASFDPSSVR